MCAPDTSPCGPATIDGTGDGLLPANPFTALQFHFGMLLGVDDLEVSQSYPRGKMRLHNAWLHRDGVVWGFNVQLNERNELAVSPGLALDRAGHELHLDRAACLDLGKWYAKNKDDKTYEFTVDPESGRVTFAVHVVAKFRACLSRQVPAISAPCADGETDTAYSRAIETVELLLRPGPAPDVSPPYHRLRILFGLETDTKDDQGNFKYPEATAARTAVLGAAPAAQPGAYLDAFRALAAHDEIDLSPQQATSSVSASIFPEDPTEVVLANVTGIVVAKNADGTYSLSGKPTIDVTVRPSHVATSTIQELSWLPLAAPAGGAPPPPPPPPPPANPGPKINAPATLMPKSIQFTVDHALAAGTLDPSAFSVTEYDDDDGWSTLDIRRVTTLSNGAVSVELKEAPTGTLVRFIARGTGPTPLMSANSFIPLGAPGAGGADDGVDFVQKFTR